MEFLNNIYGVPLYIDPYMEENSFLRGRKENGAYFLIANSKTANFLYKSFLIKIRKEKLNKIKNL